MRGRIYYRGFELVLFFLVFLFVFPHQVLADTYEYYTYGGYNAVVDAWRRIALIFGDTSFKGLYFSVIILGIIILYFIVLARSTLVGSSRFNLAGWAIPILIGVATYIAFIVPKDTIIVYDTVLNRGPESIGGIPRIMAVTAGLINKIERGMIDIVRVSSSPVEDYGRNAGGTGFVVLSHFGDPITLSLAGVPTYVQQTAYQFVKDCLLFAISKGDVSVQEINSGAKDYVAIINSAMNPGVPTVYYDPDGREVDTSGGSPVTCREAGSVLINYINYHKDAIVKTSCVLSGYNIDNPNELNACRSLIESTFVQGLIKATNGGGNLDLLAGQSFLAAALIQTINTINPESSIKLMATKEASSQYLGLAIHANTWLPVIKETLRAVSIAISPFVLLFAATPLVGRALSFILGMMVWVVTWSVIDAILHYSAVAQAQAASSEFVNAITAGTPGLMFFVLLPSYSLKVAAVFGAIRWAGLGLATVLTGMLIKFGGAALAMLAGAVTGAAQSAGAAMGRMVTDITSPIKADLLPTRSWTNAALAVGGVGMLAEGLANLQGGQLAGQAMVGGRLDFRTIVEGTASTTAGSLVKGATVGMEKAIKKGWIEGRMEGATVDEWERLMEKYGPNLPERVAAMSLRWQVGGVRAKERKENMYQIPGDVIAYWEGLGYGFYNEYVEGRLVDMVLTPGGWRVAKVKLDSLSASLRDSKQKALDKLYTLSKEVSNSISIEKIRSFLNEFSHLLSDEEVAAIKYMFDHSGRGGMKDSEDKQKGSEKRTNKELSFGLGGGLQGTMPLGGWGGLNAGIKFGWQYSKTYSDFLKSLQSKDSFTEDDIKQAFAFMIGHHLNKSDNEAWKYAVGKYFKDITTFTELAKTAEQYRELNTIENSIGYNLTPLLVQMYAEKYLSHLKPDDFENLDNNPYELAARILQEGISKGDPKILKEFSELVNEAAARLEGQLPSYQSIQQQGEDLKNKVLKDINEKEKYIKEEGEKMPMKHLPNEKTLFYNLIHNPRAWGVLLWNAPNYVPKGIFRIPLTTLPTNRLIEWLGIPELQPGDSSLIFPGRNYIGILPVQIPPPGSPIGNSPTGQKIIGTPYPPFNRPIRRWK